MRCKYCSKRLWLTQYMCDRCMMNRVDEFLKKQEELNNNFKIIVRKNNYVKN
ncbi:hypothetical protein SHM_06400 [Spiroplasma ixodetis]|uniref:Uncharacterized protein n=1 Tax=Spiroplasma ixodetis TaxID=2141 RepID=A0ABN6T0Z0_9MOLU|nr:hypothetical protein SHM_06400 [Spiroplasma ixodetis]